jgi:CRP/FNR family transcriptional activator FtrB
MHAKDLPEIRHLPLFRDMLQSSFDDLMDKAYAQSFPAGLQLIRQGDPADFLHVVMEGTVEMYADWAGRESTMDVVHPLGTFILAACIRNQPYLMSARTIERSRVILIPASDLRAIFRRDPEFAVSVVGELAGCYRAVIRHTKGLKLRNSRERVAAWFWRQAAQRGNVSSFVLPVEKRFLASYLGMTPENLSRSLKALEGDGVKMDGARVIITDRARFEALVQPDPLIDGV